MQSPRKGGIEVLGTRQWEVHFRGLNNPCGGSWGQVTKCRLGDLVFYVRENVTGRDFYMCSSARLGLKAFGKSGTPQVLELLAPEGEWDDLADAVERADGLGRHVRHNRNFTWDWATKLFSREKNE